jgi:hypothetical protein
MRVEQYNMGAGESNLCEAGAYVGPLGSQRYHRYNVTIAVRNVLEDDPKGAIKQRQIIAEMCFSQICLVHDQMVAGPKQGGRRGRVVSTACRQQLTGQNIPGLFFSV